MYGVPVEAEKGEARADGREKNASLRGLPAAWPPVGKAREDCDGEEEPEEAREARGGPASAAPRRERGPLMWEALPLWAWAIVSGAAEIAVAVAITRDSW